MKARSVVVGLAVAGVMVVGGATSGAANIAWCMEDPPLLVQTPTGSNLTVNTSVSVAYSEAKYLNDVSVQATARPDGSGGTLITLNVTVPSTITRARVVATVNKYKVYSASATVAGGTTATLNLDVPTT